MGKLRLPCIIGVAGGPASGKSLVTEKIMERLETLNQDKHKQLQSLVLSKLLTTLLVFCACVMSRESERITVVELHKTGMRTADIVRTTGFKQRTVYKIVRRYKETGGTSDRPRSGRPTTATTPENINKVRCRIRRNPEVSMNKMATDLGITAFDFDRLTDTISQLEQGKAVVIPKYDFMTSTRKGTMCIEPADVIIVEGILIFYDARLRNKFAMKLFVDADADIRLARRVLLVLSLQVKPAFEEFCLPTKKWADVIIPRGGENDVAIDLLVQHIQVIGHTIP
ncbi:unnamed protein product [Heligmosomoides polygyrus]|uniref:PRK domain-containing protein n=1 Tax=Heligmosomoides polygyrus TaxID=6339 RepID=A0A3P8A4A4_HELPZ|nr:unnamed protein product [Heligmosomoides polygyrus]